MDLNVIQDYIAELSPFLKILAIILISAIPVVEQRGSIPIGIFVGVHPAVVFITAYLGSLLPAPFILLLFDVIYEWLKKFRVFRPLINLIDHKIRKNTPRLEKYKEIGLIAFIAIPLPTTGIWTGSAVASFLGLDFKKSLVCAALGGLASAIVLTIGSYIAYINTL